MPKTHTAKKAKKQKTLPKDSSASGGSSPVAVSNKTTQPPALTADAGTAVDKPKPAQSSKERPPKLPGAVTVFRRSLELLWANWRPFAGIALVYLLLTMIFVRGLSGGTNIAELKEALGSPGGFMQFATGLALFTVLLTSSGNAPSPAAGVYQSIILLIVSLAVIWALRKAMAGEKFTVRDAFYKGMYPLVPVLLVVFVIALQLIPVLIGATVYGIVAVNGIAQGMIEKVFWISLFIGTGLLSLYFMSSSLMAAYVAALPDMTPLNALRSARQLVRGRRFSVIRKLLFLPLVLLLASVVLMLPVILVAAPLAPWIFLILSALGVVVAHSYLYTLYRALLP